MSSKYGEVPDKYFLLNTPSITYFWKFHAKSSSMKMTSTLKITISKEAKVEKVAKVGKVGMEKIHSLKYNTCNNNRQWHI